jgi:hypothetical protein
MSSDDYLKRMKTYSEELCSDPARLKAFLRSVMGPPRVTLEGKDREQALLLLALVEPFKQSNNQHSWTDHYMIGETEYHVTTFPGSDEPIVDKMLPEDD